MTAGYSRAFLIASIAVLAGGLFALLIPPAPSPETGPAMAVETVETVETQPAPAVATD